MYDAFSAIGAIAENRIREAVESGMLDKLPGQGKPLQFEDLSHVPEELRMAYKILKNAGCLPPELERRKEVGRLADLLDNCSCEREKLKYMRKLRYLLQRAGMEKASIHLAMADEYYTKILARLEAHERKSKDL